MATVCIKLSGALGLNLNPINIWEEEEEEVCVYDTQGTIQVCVRVCINSVIIFYTLGPVLMKKESTSFTSCKLFITFPRLSYCWLFDLLWFNENESYDHATDMRRCVRTVRSEIRTFLLIFKYLFILSFFFFFFFLYLFVRTKLRYFFQCLYASFHQTYISRIPQVWDQIWKGKKKERETEERLTCSFCSIVHCLYVTSLNLSWFMILIMLNPLYKRSDFLLRRGWIRSDTAPRLTPSQDVKGLKRGGWTRYVEGSNSNGIWNVIRMHNWSIFTSALRLLDHIVH